MITQGLRKCILLTPYCHSPDYEDDEHALETLTSDNSDAWLKC